MRSTSLSVPSVPCKCVCDGVSHSEICLNYIVLCVYLSLASICLTLSIGPNGFDAPICLPIRSISDYMFLI